MGGVHRDGLPRVRTGTAPDRRLHLSAQRRQQDRHISAGRSSGDHVNHNRVAQCVGSDGPGAGFPIDGQIAVAAGNFGRAREPGWCLNLRRDPHARISVHGQLRDVVAQEMAGKEREDLQQALAIYPGGAAYAKRAKNRTIAVFLLRDQISDTSVVRPPAPQP